MQEPDAYGGEVIGDSGARRGRVLRVSEDGGRRTIEAHVPLAEFFAFAAALARLAQDEERIRWPFFLVGG